MVFINALESNVPRYANIEITDYQYIIDNPPTDDEDDIAVHAINEKDNIPIEYYIGTGDDFITLWQKVREYWNKTIRELSKKIDDHNSKWHNWFSTRSEFIQEQTDFEYGRNNKDIEVNDMYNKDSFNAVFTSPRNRRTFDDITEPGIECFVDFAIVPRLNHDATLLKRYTDRNHDFKLLPQEDQKPLDDTDVFPEDFNEVFNVGNESFQNSIDYITRFHRSLEFKHV